MVLLLVLADRPDGARGLPLVRLVDDAGIPGVALGELALERVHAEAEIADEGEVEEEVLHVGAEQVGDVALLGDPPRGDAIAAASRSAERATRVPVGESRVARIARLRLWDPPGLRQRQVVPQLNDHRPVLGLRRLPQHLRAERLAEAG